MTISLEVGLGLGFGFEGSGWVPERGKIQEEQDLYRSDGECVEGVEHKDQVLA